MTRISRKSLDALATVANRRLGRPVEPYVKSEDGSRYIAQVGHLGVTASLTGYSFDETVSEGGALKNVLWGSTARDLYEKIHALLIGFDMARNT